MRKNQYPGRCVKCRVAVAAMAGFLTGPPWGAICVRCAPKDAEAPASTDERAVRIEVSPRDPAVVQIRPASYLGDAFSDFRDLTSSCSTYDRDTKTNLAARDTLLDVLKTFKDAGWKLIIAPELVASLQAEAEVATSVTRASSARLDELRARFSERRLALRVYQETGVAFLQEKPTGGILADDPGTGKTIMLYAALPDNAAAIVVCPVNAVGVWIREGKKWRPDLKITRGDGPIVSFPTPGTVTLYTYDALRRSTEKVLVAVTNENGDAEEVEYTKLVATGKGVKPAPGTWVIADEGHRLKNAKSATRLSWDALMEAAVAEKGRAFLATGSPVMNVESELFSLLEACGKLGTKIFGNKRAFKRLASTGGEAYTLKIREGLLRRTKREVMKELPPIQYSTIDVQISDATRAQLDDVLSKIVAIAVEQKVEDAKKSNEALPADARVDLDLVREQAANDVQAAIDLAFDGRIRIPFELISRVKAILATAKLPAAQEVLDDLEGDVEERARPGELFEGFVCDDPICFASANVAPVEAIASRPGWALIRGGVSGEKRAEITEKFQRGGFRGIALAIKAAGEAITLTRSSRMLINDPEWTPAAMDQLVSRIHRMGQAGRPNADAATPFGDEETNGSHVQVIRLVADHVLDRRIQEILDIKMGIVERVVETAAVGIDYRAASKANVILASLEGTMIAKTPPPGKDRRRAVTDGERAAQAVLAGYDALPTAFLQNLRASFKRDGGLTETQWTYAVKAVKEAYVLRPAKNDHEKWAARGILHLAANDPDRAAELNGVGFSKFDNELGHDLARRLDGGLLPDDGWRNVTRLAKRYQRQLPPAPPEEKEDEPTPPVAAPAEEQNPFEIGGGL